MESALYVVATPIGNLGDMVPRAVQVLQSVDLIVAEDSRHSSILLKHFAIHTPVSPYHDHSDHKAIARVAKCIEQGGSVALISDAGTPLISDPGYRLLQHAHAAGWRVVPVPGASALLAALSVAGLATDRFRFEGFLPARSSARCTQLQGLAAEPITLVFYEAPHRLSACLEDMKKCFGGDRLVVLARELTKVFETIIRAPLDELVDIVAADPNQARGEIVLLVEGASPVVAEMDGDAERLLNLLAGELPPKKVAAVVAAYTGLGKKELYRWLVLRGG
jgi:16S rRNA (cytidine1402-2'-O)-methyltransferase